jgi:23S rRNA (guanosine2251-2'-O)-methyltransferase
LIIYGKNPVREFLSQNSTKIEELFVSSGIRSSSVVGITKLAEDRGIKVSYLPKLDLAKLTKTNSHQGIAARIPDFEYQNVSELLEHCERRREKLLIVVLDHIEDPQNLGAIIRTVNVLGAHGIIIPKDRSASITPAVIKASAGAVNFVRIARVVNIVRVIRELKTKGIWVVGAEPQASKPIYDEDLYDLDLVLVIGSEGMGLKRMVKKECDYLLSIPTGGEVSSLNASVAAGLMIYEITRQRRTKA